MAKLTFKGLGRLGKRIDAAADAGDAEAEHPAPATGLLLCPEKIVVADLVQRLADGDAVSVLARKNVLDREFADGRHLGGALQLNRRAELHGMWAGDRHRPFHEPLAGAHLGLGQRPGEIDAGAPY